ncbi:MAG TPA: hypothetical protein VLV78_16415 [Thermoanaerobaculia bacterium]|nr:hypothetical protein [Thermoanaerobaculia bacterium]
MKRTVLSVAICLCASISFATSIQRYTLDEVRDRAEAIFTGSVISSTSVPVMNGQLSATKYMIEVDNVLQGAIGSTTTVAYVRPGYDGSPALQEGKRYLFFKTGHPNDTTVGWGQGLYAFETIKTESGSRTILVSADGEPLLMVNGRLARGARVRVIDGHIMAESMDRNASDPRDRIGGARNVDGTAAIRVVPAQAATAAAGPTYATFDDLKRFVASGRVRNR